VRAPGTRPKRSSLNGSAPDTSSVALLLVDVIHEFAFPEARALLRRALPMRERCSASSSARGVPGVYVNDNFGRWRSDFNAIVRHSARRDRRGRQVVQLLRPEADDYFVLKPKHSGFYESSLGVLLDHLGFTPRAAAAVVGVKPTPGVRRRKHSAIAPWRRCVPVERARLALLSKRTWPKRGAAQDSPRNQKRQDRSRARHDHGNRRSSSLRAAEDLGHSDRVKTTFHVGTPGQTSSAPSYR
jgi:hypothetical protein